MAKCNVKCNLWIASMSAVSMALGFAATAQTPAPCTTPVALGALSLAPLPKLGAPYTATVRTTVDKTLPDGSTTHASVTTYQARDAAGRLWEKRSLGCQPGTDGERHPVLQTLVYDPATGTTISWKDDDPAKVVRVLHGPIPYPRPSTQASTENEAAARAAMEGLGIHEQDLGSKVIAGQTAEGSRTVTTTSAGHKEVQESWTATDLELELLDITDNSATGRRTVEVVDLKQGNPDPALFAPPAGYTTVELNRPTK